MRPTWDEYFMSIVKEAAKRSTCDRKNVGAVIVKDNRIIATGYNGSPRGAPHCDEAGHLLKSIDGRDSCVRTIHAEVNAITHAREDLNGATLFVTAFPCFECSKLIINAGIVKIYYDEYYSSRMTDVSFNLACDAGLIISTGSMSLQFTKAGRVMATMKGPKW